MTSITHLNIEKKTFFVAILGLLCLLKITTAATAQQPVTNIKEAKAAERKPIALKSVINRAFGRGEKVTFRVHYGWLTAGVATMQVHNERLLVGNRPAYRMEVTGNSSGLIKHITDIHDVWGAIVDSAAVMPHKAYRNIQENSYKKTEEILFDYGTGTATLKASRPPQGEVTMLDNTLDMVTGYYYLRLVDYNSLAPNTMMVLTGIFEDKTYQFRIRYKGKERIKTPLGYIDAIRLQPVMPENGVFAGENSVKFYISDDENRIPLKIRAELFVGAVELDIESHEGLRHPITFAKR